MIPLLLELQHCYELTANGRQRYTTHKTPGKSIIWLDFPSSTPPSLLPGYAVMPDNALGLARLLGAVIVATPEQRDFVTALLEDFRNVRFASILEPPPDGRNLPVEIPPQV